MHYEHNYITCQDAYNLCYVLEEHLVEVSHCVQDDPVSRQQTYHLREAVRVHFITLGDLFLRALI